MAFTSLEDRLVDLPLILAGPILRKVTAPTDTVTDSSVTVWIALTKKADVTLSVHTSDSVSDTPEFSAKGFTVKIGPNLHLACVTARTSAPSGHLTHGKVYFYSLKFSVDHGGDLDLQKDGDLLKIMGSKDRKTFAYGKYRLPSFVMPPNSLGEVRIFQGSCRKAVGIGPDALARLDDFIDENHDDVLKRPHLMLMTGDQIYADEVADVMLLMLTDAAKVLLDHEPIPFETVDGKKAALLAESLPPTTRGRVVKAFGVGVDEMTAEDVLDDIGPLRSAHFTTDDYRSHLMTLGEFLAMYLFVWSPVLWPARETDIPDYAEVAKAVKDRFPKFISRQRLQQSIGATQRYRVLAFYKTLNKVRRALANIPNYMIFDDHEITDDWNMTQEFCEMVYGSVTGTRIIQNGLVAYALCQHWGNAPEQFVKGTAGGNLLSQFGMSAYGQFADDPLVARVVGVHHTDALAQQKPYGVYHDIGNRQETPDGWTDDKSLIFHYTVESKNFQIIVTDTRTWRCFPRGRKGAPDMIPAGQLDAQFGKVPPLKGRVLIIVVSTNMPPGPGIRQATRDLPSIPFKGWEQVYRDLFDSWEIDRVDYARALAEISRKFPKNQGAAVLLSGDVHSSSASRIYYVASKAQVGDKANKGTKAELVLAQLVGSPLNNQDAKTEGQHAEGQAWVPDKFIAKLTAQPIILTEGFVGWNPETTAKDTVVAMQALGGALTLKVKLLYAPDKATYTTRYEQMRNVWARKIVELTNKPEPDYRMRLDYLRAASRAATDTSAPETYDDHLKRKEMGDKAYAHYVASVRSGREVAGLSNISEFRFVKGTAPKFAVHYKIHWMLSGEPQWIEHKVSLDIGDPAYPMLSDPTP